jgi:hypothetical protein
VPRDLEYVDGEDEDSQPDEGASEAGEHLHIIKECRDVPQAQIRTERRTGIESKVDSRLTPGG